MSEVKYNQEMLYKGKVSIYTESNPNPQSMKFMLNLMLLDGQSMDFPDVESASAAPLAQALFGFPYIRRVFFMNNFITLTKDESMDWYEAIPELKGFIREYLEAGKPVFNQTEMEEIAKAPAQADTDAVRKIKEILDEYIRPAVEMDGGAIRFASFDEGTGLLKVELQGSCSGCPSSTVTLKAGIENMMKRMVPQVREVVAEGI